jgi:hypothetical protein
MADKDKPEESGDKKRGILAGSKAPLDGILLVVVPFVTFVMLFMYVMGLLPPRPMTVRVVGASPMEQVQPPAGGVPQATLDTPSSEETALSVSDAHIGETAPDVNPAPSEPADSMTLDAGGPVPTEVGPAEPVAVALGQDEAVEQGSPETTGEVDMERLERVRQLAKVYEQMNASSVAAIISNMGEDDAVDILSNMKPRNAAKVLAYLEPEKAAELSLRLTE